MSFWSGFIKRANEQVDQAIAGRTNLKITYRKANGRTVKRVITPLKQENGLIKAYDHKRKNYRSFKAERLKEVKSAPGFWDGFEKQAISLKWLDRHLRSGEQRVMQGLAKKHDSVGRLLARQRTPDQKKWWNRPASEQPIAKARAFKTDHWEKLPAAEREAVTGAVEGKNTLRYRDFSKGTRDYWRKYVSMLRSGAKKEGL